MFVKIDKGEGKLPLILNVDCISSIENYSGQIRLRMTNNDYFLLIGQEYDELCKILTTQV